MEISKLNVIDENLAIIKKNLQRNYEMLSKTTKSRSNSLEKTPQKDTFCSALTEGLKYDLSKIDDGYVTVVAPNRQTVGLHKIFNLHL